MGDVVIFFIHSQFLQEHVGPLLPKWISWIHLLQNIHEFLRHSTYGIILLVIISINELIFADHNRLSMAPLPFPFKKIYLLQQFLLMKLQLPHHDSDSTTTGADDKKMVRDCKVYGYKETKKAK